MEGLMVLDRTGDTKTTWDPENETEVSNAREQFTKWKAQGFAVFSVKKDGTPGGALSKFNPDLDKMIATPPIAGG